LSQKILIDLPTSDHALMWFESFKARKVKARIHAQMDRIEMGHLGDIAPIGE